MKRYRLKTKGTCGQEAGTICYPFRGYDYGLASDDTRYSGREHISVTLDPDGGIPSFTVAKDDLEETPEDTKSQN